MKQILSIARKEIQGFLGSPLAVIFLGAFLAVELFVFFNTETFFSRNIADVRPLFRWMPVLLVFLLAALTMRQWSEEQRSGTLEILLTLPVNLIQLVLGKFLAVMAMIVLALALTLPLPLTVSFLGQGGMDWGPVFGSYLAAILMAAAYAAIGLFISSRTDNQIVALLSSSIIGGIFYLVGTGSVTNFFGSPVSDILWAIGTGSRFESIERGVIDLRDLIYYLSLAGFFLTLNVISLDKFRWSQKPSEATRKYQIGAVITAVLLAVNLILVNIWMYPLMGLRLDLTAQREYSLSPVTKDLVTNLQEPLLIRAYISSKTHPLLAPLAPNVRDMLREYEIASHGLIKAEVLDPLTNPDIEAEANQTYGIKPTAFRVAGRHEASVINSYFDILIRYGDQSVVLNFGQLVEVEQAADRVDVRLRNLEYDLTSSIKKVVFGFQSIDAVLAASNKPIQLTLFITPNSLPQQLSNTKAAIEKVAKEIQDTSKDKFQFVEIDPSKDSKFTPQVLADQYGIQAVPVTLFGTDTFFFHLFLQNGEKNQLIYPSTDMGEGEVRTAIEAALKRTASGFLKTVGIWGPSEEPKQNMYGQSQQPVATFKMIRQQLGQEYTVRQIDLTSGQVPSDIDELVVIAPQDFTDKELFAIDQFLMRGGSLVVAANNYKLDIDMQGGLVLTPAKQGVSDLLKNYGIELTGSLVMDPQSDVFPATVMRQVGDTQIPEITPMYYPYFVDVRPNGMDTKNPITSNLMAITLNWASPLNLDAAKMKDKTVSTLLSSSNQSYLFTPQAGTPAVDIQPNYEKYADTGFAAAGANDKLQSYPLAVAITGSFESAFKGKPSPFQTKSVDSNKQGPPAPGEQQGDQNKMMTVSEKSPADTRLVVVGSSDFLNDSILELSARLTQDRFRNNLQFLQNTVDWGSEDLDLLTIRSRGTFTRVLKPLDDRSQNVVEIANYIVALVALLAIYFVWNVSKRNEKPLALLPKRGDSSEK